MRGLVVAHDAFLIVGTGLEMMTAAIEIIVHRRTPGRRDAVAVVLALIMAIEAGRLWHEAIVGEGIAVALMRMADRAVRAFVMDFIGPVGRVAIVRRVRVAGRADVFVVGRIRLVEAVRPHAIEEEDFPISHFFPNRGQIAASMRVVAIGAVDDERGLGGVFVILIAVRTDHRAGRFGQRVAARTQRGRAIPEPRVVFGGEVRQVGIVAVLTGHARSLAVSVRAPIGVHRGRGFAVQAARFGAVVASCAILNAAAFSPDLLCLGHACFIAMTVVARGRIGQIRAIAHFHPTVVMSGIAPVAHGGMAAIATCKADVALFVAQMRAAGRWIAVADGAACGVGAETAAMRVTFGAILVFVMGGCGRGAVIARLSVTDATDAVGRFLEGSTVERHRATGDGVFHQGRVGGLAVGFVACGA